MKVVWLAALVFVSAGACAQSNSLLGNWRNPTGSTIQIYPCGSLVCARLVGTRKGAPSRVDAKNPNSALRSRPLCGLEIGTNFRLVKPGRAEDGRLYDPESGNTYSGSMTLDGNKLKLRGYIGLALLGRTEVWTRAPAGFVPCRP